MITKYIATALSFLALPVIASAQFATSSGVTSGGGPLEAFVQNVVNFTNSILLPAVLAIAFFVFVWGIFKFFILGGANDEAKEQGKSLMIYATLGFVFIVIFWGLVNFLANSIGLQNDKIQKINTPFNFGGTQSVGG